MPRRRLKHSTTCSKTTSTTLPLASALSRLLLLIPVAPALIRLSLQTLPRANTNPTRNHTPWHTLSRISKRTRKKFNSISRSALPKGVRNARLMKVLERARDRLQVSLDVRAHRQIRGCVAQNASRALASRRLQSTPRPRLHKRHSGKLNVCNAYYRRPVNH